MQTYLRLDDVTPLVCLRCEEVQQSAQPSSIDLVLGAWSQHCSPVGMIGISLTVTSRSIEHVPLGILQTLTEVMIPVMGLTACHKPGRPLGGQSELAMI